MNWKQALNPWGYARGLAAENKIYKQQMHIADTHIEAISGLKHREYERVLRLVKDREQIIADLRTELATALDALRIADECADKKAVACDAAHDRLEKTFAPPPFAAVLDDGAHPFKAKLVPSKVSAIPKRTATAPGGAELHIKDNVKPNNGADAAYAKHVKENGK